MYFDTLITSTTTSALTSDRLISTINSKTFEIYIESNDQTTKYQKKIIKFKKKAARREKLDFKRNLPLW